LADGGYDLFVGTIKSSHKETEENQ